MASKEEDTAVVENVGKGLKMSRGDGPEIDVPFEQVEHLTVLNEKEEKIRFGDLYANQKCIIVFVRHFLCFMCKEYVDDLAKIPKNTFEDSGVKLIVIGCAKPKFIEEFKKDTGFEYDLYVDPDRILYKLLGCVEKPNIKTKTNASRHVKSGFLMGTLKSAWRSMKFKEWQGEPNQQGAAFVLGPGNEVHYAHLDQLSSDHAAINDLLSAAGVDVVNFDKDKRVLHV